MVSWLFLILAENGGIMHYRNLGKNGPKISVIGVGTWQFGGEWGKDFTSTEVREILTQAQEEGINLLDTAECYGDHLSEKLIGEAIEGTREKWIVASKFGHGFTGHMQRKQSWKKSEVAQQLDDSLKALKTDYIDLYQFHSGKDEQFFQDDLWTYLDKQVQAGKIRWLGLSISRKLSIKQIEAAPDYNISAVQIVYNRLERDAEKEALPLCKQLGLGVLARVPLASGLLSGKYQKGAEFPPNDVRGSKDKKDLEKTFEEVDKIAKQEVPEGVSMAQWALAWTIKDEMVTTTIPGCKNISQTKQNARAVELLQKDVF